MIFSGIKRAGAAILWASLMIGCQDQGTNSVLPPITQCTDPGSLHLGMFSITKHKYVDTLRTSLATLPGVTWAPSDSVQSFFGGKAFKVVFTMGSKMYLLTYANGQPVVTLLSHGDEGLSGQNGSINSPLFSPDGKKIVYAGTILGKPAFIQDVTVGDSAGLRAPVDHKLGRAHVTADPHWFSENGKTWIYFATLANLVFYSAGCQEMAGSTYRVEVLGDTTSDSVETTGIRGAYRGGLSKDGEWAATAYATAALYNRVDSQTIVLAGGAQQCNPSMNPYAPGSLHTDYMMTLAFGGKYHTLPDSNQAPRDSVLEGLHENLWIYNKDNKIVWRARRPDTAYYELWDKPEWSTHPNYATAVAMPHGTEVNGDLVVVKIGDLASASEDTLHHAEGYLVIGKGSFTRDSYNHLWVDTAQ